MSRTLTYAAKRIPEIADTVVEVDRAMRWGFGWELGPFEAWAVGIEKSVANEGRRLSVPMNVEQMLATGATFHKKRTASSSILTLLPANTCRLQTQGRLFLSQLRIERESSRRILARR